VRKSSRGARTPPCNIRDNPIVREVAGHIGRRADRAVLSWVPTPMNALLLLIAISATVYVVSDFMCYRQRGKSFWSFVGKYLLEMFSWIADFFL
jgi:hypothetical protein